MEERVSVIKDQINEIKAQKRLKTKLNRLKKDISVHEIG
ncbi:hypothetical protein [Campylobacter showae]